MARVSIFRRLLGIICCLALLVAACGQPDEATETTTDTAAQPQSEDAIERVKTEGLFPGFFGELPVAFIDDAGNYAGVEAEIVKACAANIGITEIFPVQVAFSGLIPGLLAKRFDMIAAGMALSDERSAVAAPTQPIYNAGARAMVPEGNPLNIHSREDIAAANARMGYISGGLEGERATELGIENTAYETLDAMVSDLRAGRIDVVMTAEDTLARYIREEDPPFELVDPWDYGVRPVRVFYFHLDDTTLRDAFDDCLTAMKADGSIAAILDEWGLNPDNVLPPPAEG